METPIPQALPDVAHDQMNFIALDAVGMSGIEVPVLLRTSDGVFRQAAKVDAHVSLDLAASRGIHMSRLYLTVQELLSKQELTLELLRKATTDFLASHRDLSSTAQLSIRLEWATQRKSLITANFSWRSYPVVLSATRGPGGAQSFIEVLITYSSTCPASAALSRRLTQEAFEQEFAGRPANFEEIKMWLGEPAGMPATPHSQRSTARIKVQTASLTPIELIDRVEEALQTAVQGAVKREDEQEFARRNGQNLMFCEDAARRVHKALSNEPLITDFVAAFDHIESLHPHSATSLVRKGVPGGLCGF